MTVLALSLTTADVILNPYPLSGVTGLGLGFMPWLISGGMLVQHQPFDYDVFARQILDEKPTFTALPASIIGELSKDGAFQRTDCNLKRIARVWSVPELAGSRESLGEIGIPLFDAYPLGDLACAVRTKTRLKPGSLPRGKLDDGETGGTTFIETA